ncbi:MAG TPA: tetratricopeptide repeat protein [candidate division WOR-3 bacterium]|uniref:Tetratricopeptide repeat protein n=1 Tax=candidate division WOR-3 bacterium TaxID=2052148 RepID=A0A9C9ENK3_UNCW3|nr:tetratricopeptide repeat protein [candidate division WOR-3 bacterium]
MRLIFLSFFFLSILSATEIDIAEEYFLEGLEFYNNKEYKTAIERYYAAVKIEPMNGLYRLALAGAYGKHGQYEKAIPHLKKAVKLDTTLIDAYYLIEQFYAELAMEDSAINYFRQEKSLHPGRAELYINLGHLYYRKKDFDKAIEEFSQAQILAPGNPISYCGMGVVLLAEGKDDTAAIFFKEAIKLDSLYPEAHLYYSLVLERKGLRKEADSERRLAYQLKPELKDVDLSGVLPLRGEKADIPFIVSTLDIIIARLIRPEERLAELIRKPFDLNLGTGITTINKEKWFSIKSNPAMETKWVGFKLSLELLVNKDSIRTKEWNYKKIFQTVRLGHPNLPFYFGVGSVNNYTLGLGLIIRDYFNQADENNRKLGSMFALQTKDNTIGVCGMVNSFSPMEVTVGHAYLGKWAQYPDDLLQRAELGFTYAQDNEYDYKVLGGDLLVYLASHGAFHFLVASEVAKTLQHGMGNVTGLLIRFGGMGKKDISFSLYGAGLFLSEDFEPAPFDAFYEKERRQYGSDVVNTVLARYQEKTNGFYATSGFNLGSIMKFSADYQSVSGVDSSGLFTARISVADDENIPVILQGVFYKSNFDDFNTLTTMDENTYIAGIAGLKVLNGLISLNLLYERTYLWGEDDAYEVQEKISPFIQFGARF